jgi:hypothetical protein
MKANKFNAKKTTVDGHTFDSKAEASRYIELKMLKKAKKIDRLELQPTFSLHVDGELIGKYRADFLYIDLSTGKEVVEDVKGGEATKTPLYRWKKKHLKAEHGIDIVEVLQSRKKQRR